MNMLDITSKNWKVMMYYPSFVSKLFYTVLLSPLQSRQSVSQQLKTIRSPNISNYERMIITANLADRLIPRSVSWIAKWMLKNPRFPWQPVNVALLAFGSGAAVLKLSLRDGRDEVLRMYGRSLGKSRQQLVEVASYYKKNYELIVNWYGNIPGLVLPMDFMILDGFPLIGPVATSFQQYVDGQKFDLFEDFSDQELLSLFASSNFLREQFVLFANQTIQQWSGQKMCYDFLGRENVMLVKNSGNYQLNIVDVGIFKFDNPEHNTPDKVARIKERIARLRELLKQTEQIREAT